MPAFVSDCMLSIPEFQEHWSYNDLLLIHFTLPKIKAHGCSEVFWGKFRQKNRIMIVNICNMLQVMFPNVVDRQVFQGRTQQWLHACVNPNIETFILHHFGEARIVSNIKYMRCNRQDEEIRAGMAQINANTCILLEAVIDVPLYIKYTHEKNYMSRLTDLYSKFVGDEIVDWDKCKYTTWLLWYPWQNVFFIVNGRTRTNFVNDSRESSGRAKLQIKRTLDDTVLKIHSFLAFGYVPLPGNWLGWCYDESTFNGLVKETKQAFMFEVQPSLCDVIVGNHYSPLSVHSPLVETLFTRSEFRNKLFTGNTMRRGCKQYVAGDVFELTTRQIEDDAVYIIDTENVNIPVNVHLHVLDSTNMDIGVYTVIKVNGNRCSSEFRRQGHYMNLCMSEKQKFQTRSNDNNRGVLVTYGVHEYNGVLEPFAANKTPTYKTNIRKEFTRMFAAHCCQYYPLEFSTVIQAEYSCGITHELTGHPCNSMHTYASSSLNCSIGYASSQHKDTRDNSMTCISWFNSNQDIHTLEEHKNAYFLFGNVQINKDNKVYNGLAIKLYDGVSCTFDARLLLHGTTIAPCNCLFGGYALVGNAVTASSKLA